MLKEIIIQPDQGYFIPDKKLKSLLKNVDIKVFFKLEQEWMRE
jgi:hypothetical protein